MDRYGELYEDDTFFDGEAFELDDENDSPVLGYDEDYEEVED